MDKLYVYDCDIPPTLPKKYARIKINEQVYQITREDKKFVRSGCIAIDKEMLNKLNEYSHCYESYYTEPNIKLYKKQLLSQLQSEISYMENQIEHIKETIKLLERSKKVKR